MSIVSARGASIARFASARSMRLLRDVIRYAAASALALALDCAVLSTLTTGLGVGYLQAAAAGFLSGLGLIYLLSIHYVFEGRRRRAPRTEIAGFLVTGIVGLISTEALMGLFVGRLGAPLLLAKAATAGFVFAFNFLTRRGLLFKAG